MEYIASLVSNADCRILSNENKNTYGLDIINAKEMWDKGYSGKGIKIAIIDTGCDINHEFLKDSIIGGKNFTSEDNGDSNIYMDYQGHGTHVSGIVKSVARDCELLILKVLDKSGNGGYSSIVAAIDYAVTQKVDIISMSLGGAINDASLYNAIVNAMKNNILVVCAAGNNGDGNDETDEFSYPAAYDETIEVGAIDGNYSVTDFSNSNKLVDLVAPGKDIASTYPNNKYAELSGTSQATPFVSGALALIKQYCREDFKRELSESELYAQLIKYTKNINGVSRTMQGNGFLYLDPFSNSK